MISVMLKDFFRRKKEREVIFYTCLRYNRMHGTLEVALKGTFSPDTSTAFLRPRRPKQQCLQLFMYIHKFFLQILALLTVIPLWVCNLRKIWNLWLFLRKKIIWRGWVNVMWHSHQYDTGKFLNLINVFINELIYLTGSWDSFLNGNTCMSVVSMASRLFISIVICFYTCMLVGGSK